MASDNAAKATSFDDRQHMLFTIAWPDRDGFALIRSANDFALQVLGYNLDELVPVDSWILDVDDDQAHALRRGVAEAFQAAKDHPGKHFQARGRMRAADDHAFDIDIDVWANVDGRCWLVDALPPLEEEQRVRRLYGGPQFRGPKDRLGLAQWVADQEAMEEEEPIVRHHQPPVEEHRTAPLQRLAFFAWELALTYYANPRNPRLTRDKLEFLMNEAAARGQAPPDTPLSGPSLDRARKGWPELVWWPILRGERPPWESDPSLPRPPMTDTSPVLHLEAVEGEELISEPVNMEVTHPDGHKEMFGGVVFQLPMPGFRAAASILAAAFSLAWPWILDGMDGHRDGVIHWCLLAVRIGHRHLLN